MMTSERVQIDAPAEVVWGVYSDVEAWSTWTQSVRSVALVGGGRLSMGAEADIDQPKLPKVRWKVTALEPGRSWAWSARSPGAHTVARHDVAPEGAGSTTVELSVEQTGPIGALVGLAYRGLTRRYLAMEAAGLKARSEALARAGSSPAGLSGTE